MKVVWTLLFIITTVYCQNGTKCFYYRKGIFGTCQENCAPHVWSAMVKLNIGNSEICDGRVKYYCCIDNIYVNPVKEEPSKLANRSNTVSYNKCMEYSNMTINLSSRGFEDKISSGRNASIHDFPHMAALGNGTDNEIIWKCGGSLISERFILTAAHCVINNITYVQLGEAVLNKAARNNTYKIKNRFIHPGYKSGGKYNDIALLELHKEVKFTSTIKPACLSIDEEVSNSEVYVTGWGRTDKGRRSDVLQETSLQLLENSYCSYSSDVIRTLPEGLQDSQMCAVDSGNRDTCEGDSGGPLQVHLFQYKLHNILGVTSNGRPSYYCGSPDVPGLYARVSSYLKWIEDIVWSPTRISDTKCEEYSKQLLHMVDGLGEKIFGGRNAREGEFPHMAALGYGKRNDIKWQCGGSLISEKFILTTAHCRYSREYGKVKYVRLGFIAINEKLKLGNFFYIKDIHVHEQYRPPSIYNDIALVELRKPVKFSARIKPACLYTEYFKNLEHNTLFATGWGLTSSSGSFSETLQQVDLKLYENCTSYYEPYHRILYKGVLGSQLCAGSELQKDTCQGDAGGPLQVLDFKKKLHVVAGLTSAGDKCGGDRPALYTRVSSYVDWIESIVWPPSLLVNDIYKINDKESNYKNYF